MIQLVKPHKLTVPYPLLRPRPGCPLRFVSRSKHLVGVDTHYGSNGTFICPGEDDCPSCRKGEPPRYQGYLLGESIVNNKIAIIHLTAAAAEEVWSLEIASDGLVGARFVLERSGPKQNSPVNAIHFGWDEAVDALSQHLLVECLVRLYRCHGQKVKPFERK